TILPLIHGDSQQQFRGMFLFDNYLTLSSDFIPTIQNIWLHEIVGVLMFSVTRKLKALKPIVWEQRRKEGDLAHDVELARGFLERAQVLVSANRQDELLLYLEHYYRLVYAKAAKIEQIIRQRAKMQWMKGGDQCSRIFFCKITQRRSVWRILQINDDHGATHTDPGE
ncbi:UNVERIFIED_CONTAM: hypothetical protein Sindi_1992500, partial [Sesamum indicum]